MILDPTVYFIKNIVPYCNTWPQIQQYFRSIMIKITEISEELSKSELDEFTNTHEEMAEKALHQKYGQKYFIDIFQLNEIFSFPEKVFNKIN